MGLAPLCQRGNCTFWRRSQPVCSSPGSLTGMQHRPSTLDKTHPSHQSSNLLGLPDSYRSILSRQNYHPKGCNCISIANTGTGKSHFIQLFLFVLCSTRGHWSIITKPECCCSPFLEMVTAVHKWKKSTEISGVVSALMGLRLRWKQGSE